jgi:IMP dehydrogenase
MRKAVTFDDVLIEPQFSDITSREDIDVSSQLDTEHALDLPIISSPMDTVTEWNMAKKMAEIGGLGIIHRYNTIEHQADLVKMALAGDGDRLVGGAIGVADGFLDRACALYDAGAKLICIDVAHGHHALVKYALTVLRNTFGSAIHIMAGNVATLKGFNDLADWGADSIRVGIGGGSICSTRIQTGHGIPTLQSVIDCAESDRSAKLIADGGMKMPGDIAKALAAGADFVILGSLLAGTDESPGPVIEKDGQKIKRYRGMASFEAQYKWRGRITSLEGVSHHVDYRGSTFEVVYNLMRGVKSGMSYSGAKSLVEFRSKALFIKQTASGLAESGTHIKTRF